MAKAGRACSVCAADDSASITKEIVAGGSNRVVADRFKLAPSAIQRHRTNCLRAPRKAKKPKESAGSPSPSVRAKSGRFVSSENGRCPTCGLQTDDGDPKTLLRRAERALYYGETIVMKAVEDSNDRLALQGLDRVRSSLEQLLRVHGLLVPDNATFIDARKQSIEVFGKLSEDELREHLVALRQTPIAVPGASPVEVQDVAPTLCSRLADGVNTEPSTAQVERY